MTPPRPEQPATAAGRALLDPTTDAGHALLSWAEEYGFDIVDDILAIEREAAAAALPVAELAYRITRLCLDDDHVGQIIVLGESLDAARAERTTNDLSASVRLVDAVLSAAKRAGLVLVDEASGIVVPDASEAIRRYLTVE